MTSDFDRLYPRVSPIPCCPVPHLHVKGFTCRFPPEGGKHSVEVSASDFDRLESEEFLNDTVIDFYTR